MTEKQDSESTSESSGKGQKTDESGHVNAESKQSSGCVGGKKVANSGMYMCMHWCKASMSLLIVTCILLLQDSSQQQT